MAFPLVTLCVYVINIISSCCMIERHMASLACGDYWTDSRASSLLLRQPLTPAPWTDTTLTPPSPLPPPPQVLPFYKSSLSEEEETQLEATMAEPPPQKLAQVGTAAHVLLEC